MEAYSREDVQALPVGTNLALLHFLWMLVSGALLPSRGALFPALKSTGLSDAATRGAWLAFRKGVWQMPAILILWREQIRSHPDWKAHRYEGYRPVPVDVTAFWRPALKNCPSKHYDPAAKRALPAVIFGISAEVGELSGQRIALPRAFERVHPKDPSEARLWEEMLKHVKKGLQEDEIAVIDAGVKIADLQEAGLERYVLRLAVNFTARRNFFPAHERGRKPKYGAIVRPLPRKYKDKKLAATAPDEIYTWFENERELRAEIWREQVVHAMTPEKDNKTFDVYAIYDPDFAQPWLLAVPLKLKPESMRALYKDRWPELALLAGSILSFLAAAAPAVTTGFWDRLPKRTPGRFRRTLIGRPFPKDAELSRQLRKKNSETAHLPKGILARRTKFDAAVPSIAT